MNTFRILLTIALCLSTHSNAAANMAAGVKGGVNLSHTYGDDDPGVNIKMLPGFTAGGFFQLKFNKYLAVQPEILFSGKGKKSEFLSTGFDEVTREPVIIDSIWGTERLRINYLEIPLLLQLVIPAGKIFSPLVYAGPSIGIKLGLSGKMDALGKETEYTEAYLELIDHTKIIDIGIAMGSGFTIKAGIGKILTDIRFTLGVSNVNEDGYTETRNMVLSIMGGYMFDF